MDLARISKASELQSLEHPHFGRIQRRGFLKTTIDILGGTSRKAVSLEAFSSGARQTVALDVDPNDFMVTISKSSILVTLKEGSRREPVMRKAWQHLTRVKGEGLTEFLGTVDTYVDSDGLKWEHRLDRATDEDELVGFGRDGQEILLITLESVR